MNDDVLQLFFRLFKACAYLQGEVGITLPAQEVPLHPERTHPHKGGGIAQFDGNHWQSVSEYQSVKLLEFLFDKRYCSFHDVCKSNK